MSALCGACNTENRDAAKFCKGCGRKIAQAWPQAQAGGAALATDLGALLPGVSLNSSPPARANRPAALESPRAAAGPAPTPDVAPDEGLLDFAAPRARISNGRWIAVVLAAVVLLVGAAGWYGHKNRSIPITVDAAAPTAAPAGVTVAVPEAPAAATAAKPVMDAPPAAAPSVVSEKIELAPAAPEPAKPAAKPRAAAAKKAPPPVAVVQDIPAPPPPAPAPAPVVVQAPQSQCTGRNIIATAQCMAEQCGKAQFSGHAQCEAVRRQQRLEEEKRNPSLVY